MPVYRRKCEETEKCRQHIVKLFNAVLAATVLLVETVMVLWIGTQMINLHS